jgi:hypothetical protein
MECIVGEQVDEGYPSERVMMTEDIAVILFYNTTLLVKNPDPYQDIVCAGTDTRKKLGPKRYSFTARGLTPNVTVGDLFVVMPPGCPRGLLLVRFGLPWTRESR